MKQSFLTNSDQIVSNHNEIQYVHEN